MIEPMLQMLGAVALALGCFFMVSGAVGLVRFPDFYTRMHAAGITDTLATFLIIGGLMLTVGWSLALFKLGLILLFIFFTSPTASHALAMAAQHSDLKLPDISGCIRARDADEVAQPEPAAALEVDAVNADRV